MEGQKSAENEDHTKDGIVNSKEIVRQKIKRRQNSKERVRTVDQQAAQRLEMDRGSKKAQQKELKS